VDRDLGREPRGRDVLEHGEADDRAARFAHDGEDEDGRREREGRRGDGGGGGSARRSNIVLLGAMGSGKSTVGWVLSRIVGYGFIDTDALIEARVKKPVSVIFAERGEAAFRELEAEVIQRLRGLRSHVVSVGGGAVMGDANWQILQDLGATVWLNAPPAEIARRFNTDDGELKKRPLLSELADYKDKEQRQKLLTERLSALIGQRMERYRQATVAVSDSFSTPESTAHSIREVLVKEGILRLPAEHRAYDRWRSY
jgi:shikimate kinase